MDSPGYHVEVGEAPSPLVIYKSVNRAGATFSLSPDTQHALEQRFGANLHPAPRVFVAHATQDDYNRHREERVKIRALLYLLTGLQEDRLSDLGKVEFRDPVTDELL